MFFLNILSLFAFSVSLESRQPNAKRHSVASFPLTLCSLPVFFEHASFCDNSTKKPRPHHLLTGFYREPRALLSRRFQPPSTRSLIRTQCPTCFHCWNARGQWGIREHPLALCTKGSQNLAPPGPLSLPLGLSCSSFHLSTGYQLYTHTQSYPVVIATSPTVSQTEY